MWTISGWYKDGKETGARDSVLIHNRADLRRETLRERGDENLGSVVKEVVKYHRQRLDAVPDLGKYPELRGMRELVIAEQRGIQEGAGMDDEQTALYFSGYEYYHRNFARTPKKTATQTAGANCSCIYFPTSDCGALFANNLDSSPAELFGKPEWPLTNEFLILGGVSSGVYMDELSPEIFPAPVFKLIARYCRNTKEAVEILTRYNFFWGPGNLMVIDRGKNTAMIEKSSCRIGVRWSPDGFGFITAMTAEEPGMNAYLADRRAESIKFRGLAPGNIDEIYWKKQDKRRALMNELLDEARRNPTQEFMRKFIQFRDPVRGNVCGFGDRYMPDGPSSEYTIRTVIWKLREGKAIWWAQVGDKPSWENRMPDEEFKDVLVWD